MQPVESHRLGRRFIELPVQKRQRFLEGLRHEGIDFPVLPIPSCDGLADRDIASYAQRRMWLLWRLDPRGAAYNLPMTARLKGTLNRGALQSAFDTLVRRHEALRTIFREQDDEVLQQVLEPAPVTIEIEDLTTLLPAVREDHAQTLAEAEVLAPFDLTHGPLLRVRLLKLAEREHILLLSLHHIVADGWSLALLVDEFVRLYDAACAGADSALPALPIQYRDYAMWQRSWLEAGEEERQLAYWRETLGDDHGPPDVPTDLPRPSLRSHHGDRYEFLIEPLLVERLRALAARHNTTLFMVLLAAFQLLIQRYSGQSSIRVGVPIANRHRAEVEGLIGCFINTQVLQTEIDPLIGVDELLRRVKQTMLGAQAHQDVPFERLVEALQVPRVPGHTPLFQVMFNHQANVVDAKAVSLRSGLLFEQIELRRHTARFDLTLNTHERGGALHASFIYALDVFSGETVALLSRHWVQLLDGIAKDATTAVGELQLEPAEDRVNDSAKAPTDTWVHRLIERMAARDPGRVAAVSGDISITYSQLNERADALARHLVAAGSLPDHPVGIVADRSVDMLVGVVGILKAGAAYLPLEPDQPRERLEFLIADSGVRWVLARSNWKQHLPAHVARIVLDDPLPSSEGQRAPPLGISAHNLAYVIYTSGTTGTPKGVAVSHGALSNYIGAVSERLPLDSIQSMLMVSTPAADLGHTVLFGALCSGKTLHMLDQQRVLDADAFAAYVSKHAVDAMKIVPSHLEAMLAAGAAALPRRCLILGGEACSSGLLARIATLAPRLTVINHYGPTETTVGVLTQPLSSEVTLGRPLRNIRTRVLDGCLQPVPGSAQGELHIGGVAVARGYLGRPALTAERFVPDPADSSGGRMYRTGDWVRRHRDGALLFIGRMDGQVKIRGHRVELAEIESRLRALSGIENALVRVVGDDSARQLAAYLVPVAPLKDAAAERILLNEVRRSLQRVLPDHMVPAYLLAISRLPVTANGKVDVRALPQPTATTMAYVPPITPLQIDIASIWAEVLQVERVGLTDNFFALGGHSLLATQVVSRVRKRLGTEVPLRALFDSIDLAAFAEAVAQVERRGDAEIEKLDRTALLPASHAQHRQWLFWKLHPDSTAYHTPLAVRLRGELDRGALQSAFDALIVRHESLRTVFHEEHGVPSQRIEPPRTASIDYEDLSGHDSSVLSDRLREEASATFDLERGPLLRVKVFIVQAHEHVVAVTLHHIVSDGWSMSVMVRELMTVYNAVVDGRAQTGESLPVQYADYASWQRRQLADGKFQAQLEYWKSQLEDDFLLLELPADRIRPSVQSYRGGRIDVELAPVQVTRLRDLAVQRNVTLFQLLLAMFAILLARYSGRDKINIGVPVTNRNRWELEGLIGFFVNSIVARIAVDPAATAAQLLAAVKETTLQAQANKDVPFEALVEALKPERALNHNPLFQVMYNHLSSVGERVLSDSVRALHAEEIDLGGHTAQFDLMLDTLESEQGIRASFTYATDLFDATTIQRLATHWCNLLDSVVRNPQQRIGELQLLDAGEMRDANRTEADYPRDRCLPQLFEQQVEQTPAALALVFGKETLSYRQLNARANRLAHRLMQLGVGPEIRVGIAVERGLDMVVGLLGVMKAGGAYVPMDPEYPSDRLSYMIQDSGLGLLLTQSSLQRRLLLNDAVRTLCLDEASSYVSESGNPLRSTHPESAAYVIYTSGSTGQPKGVAVCHRALLNFLSSMQAQPGLNAGDKILGLTSLSFDIAALELYLPWLVGASTVLLTEHQNKNPQALLQLIERESVSTIQATPSAWRALLEIAPPEALRDRRLLSGGEALPLDLASQLASRGSQAWNLYGPTETTVWSALQFIDPKAPVPWLGRPIANTTLHVVGASLDALPAGVSGELLIGGEGLARGYLDRPALTAERFIPDAFGDDGGRLYRTGDLARYRADGVLEYVGRSDHQVKIRGFRIELGEIEARLRQHAAIHDAVVVAQELAAGRQLVGYVVPVSSQVDLFVEDEQLRGEARRGLVDALKTFLRSTLPEYMVPSHWTVLKQFPLTPNGKLDRKAFPKPDVEELRRAHVPPGTELERRIAAIWAQMLGVERVGLGDNFFDLGGHSLLAAQVTARLQSELAVNVPLVALFEAGTLQAYATSIAGNSARSAADLDDLRDFMSELEAV